MDTTELARALQAATEDLDPRPGFTTDVARGGRRRRFRHRVVVVTAAATVTAIAGAGSYVIGLDPSPGETQVATGVLTGPTKGDLAGNQRFADDLVRAWQDGMALAIKGKWIHYDKLLGQAHVFWAGNTPAGPAGLVVQQVTGSPLPGSSTAPAPDLPKTAIGLVATDPTDGKLKLVGFDYQVPAAFLFGPDDRTVLIVDVGKPVYLATPRYDDPEGRIIRNWQRVSFADGVAITERPAGGAPADLVALPRDRQPLPDEREFSDGIGFSTASTYVRGVEAGRPPDSGANPLDFFTSPVWRGPEMIRRVGGATPQVADALRVFSEALERHGALDRGIAGTAYEQWCVVASLPDGRTAIVTERVLERLPNRLFTVLIGADGRTEAVLPGNVLNHSEALPVRVRMPDARGWVVANYGAQLAFRTGPDGQWQDAGRDAALLPDNAVQVRVIKDGGEKVVELPR